MLGVLAVLGLQFAFLFRGFPKSTTKGRGSVYRQLLELLTKEERRRTPSPVPVPFHNRKSAVDTHNPNPVYFKQIE